MKLEKKICKKKRCQLTLTFKTHNPNHYIINTTSKKTHEVQFLINQMLKGEIGKKKTQLYRRIQNKKITIKRMRDKIK